MKLSELKNGRQNVQQQQPLNADIGTIRAVVAYPRPFEALFEGQPVTVLATGDIIGMSPSVQIVDEHGQLEWVSTEDVTVTQREILPQTEQQRSRLAQRRQQQNRDA